jgi:hypothetical protein
VEQEGDDGGELELGEVGGQQLHSSFPKQRRSGVSGRIERQRWEERRGRAGDTCQADSRADTGAAIVRWIARGWGWGWSAPCRRRPGEENEERGGVGLEFSALPPISLCSAVVVPGLRLPRLSSSGGAAVLGGLRRNGSRQWCGGSRGSGRGGVDGLALCLSLSAVVAASRGANRECGRASLCVWV